MDKKAVKKAAKKCRICKTDIYATLHVHRINPGSKGGKYREQNVVVLCSNCHNSVHSGIIEIDRYYQSTAGMLLRIIRDGKEEFI